ncbi:MAG: protein-L-isoaspartate(D-aspartate) O-methyltransferase [Chrysiogenetes bacterium]|nr:protein-L-isoaspartate(D-aspartate) O-methyltransferase [Chrysiogenetes bacterium]
MVDEQLRRRGIKDERVLAAMEAVRREVFCPPNVREHAYEDKPLPIGYEQTISQPYIVGYMSEALQLSRGEKVLEVGTGSGYQAAVLARMGMRVYSVEVVPELAERARETLEAHGYEVHVRAGDGYAGWPEEAPFDAIIVTAAPESLPQELLDQLAPGGRLVVPVGPQYAGQELRRYRKDESGQVSVETLLPVRFVPMVREN